MGSDVVGSRVRGPSKAEVIAAVRSWGISLAAALFPVAGAAASAPLPPGTEIIGSDRESPFAGTTSEQIVRELADREDLRELIFKYAHRAALGINIADLFTDDGTLIVRRPGQEVLESRGRKAIDATYNAISARPGAQLPMIHNVLLQIDGDTATGLCSVEVRGDAGGQNIIGSAYYADRFRREGGRWKFVRRDVHFFHFTTLEKGWATPLEK